VLITSRDGTLIYYAKITIEPDAKYPVRVKFTEAEGRVTPLRHDNLAAYTLALDVAEAVERALQRPLA
jgi:hypothetical protein